MVSSLVVRGLGSEVHIATHSVSKATARPNSESRDEEIDTSSELGEVQSHRDRMESWGHFAIKLSGIKWFFQNHPNGNR